MSQATAQILDPTPLEPDLDFEMVYSDGEPLDTPWHRRQINLFDHVTRMAMVEKGRDDVYVGGDMFVYYSPQQAKAIAAEVLDDEPPELLHHPGGTYSRRHFKGPDIFAVVGGVEPRDRKAWVTWEENGRAPDFVLEFQSKKTARVDRGAKRTFYAETFRSREYFYYGPDDEDLPKKDRDVLVGLQLAGESYEEIEPDARGWMWSEVLGASVGRWDGVYNGQEGRWIRLYDAGGRLIPTEAEAERQRAGAEHQRAEAERQRAEAERQRAEAAVAEIARLKKRLDSANL